MIIYPSNKTFSRKALSSALLFAIVFSLFQPFYVAAAVTPDVITTIETISTPGSSNWVVPTGVTEIRVKVWGSGGSAGNGSTVSGHTLGGGGGGGGGYAEKDIAVTPGESFTAIVARGGLSSAEGADRSGKTSSFSASSGVLVSASGGKAGKRGSEIQAPAPTIALSATPGRFNAGDSTTITWSTTNVDSCVASGIISGNKSASGSQTASPSSSGSVSFTCTGLGGTASASISITVDNCGPRGGCFTGPDFTVSGNSSAGTTVVATNPLAAGASAFTGESGDGLVGTTLVSGASASQTSFNSSMNISSTKGGDGAQGGNGGARSTTGAGSDGVSPAAGGGGSNVAQGGNGADGRVVIQSIVRGGPVPNLAPTGLVVTGPTSGDTGVSYSFSAQATDPESSNVRYGFDWDNNGTIDEYTPFVASGSSAILSHSWGSAGSKTFSVYAEDTDGNRSAPVSHTIAITEPCGPRGGCFPDGEAPTGLVVTGPTVGTTSVSYSFTATANDSDSATLRYGFDWDNDGTIDEYTAYVASGVSASESNSWPTAGTFVFRVYAEDVEGERSAPVSHSIVISAPVSPNSAPTGFVIGGPASGIVGTSYDFSTNALDAEGDAIRYVFDWEDDGTFDTTTAFGPSNVATTTSHSWPSVGTYTIRAYAEDVHGARSSEVTHVIVITSGGGGVNNAPTGLVVTGPVAGTTSIPYTFTATATDPEGSSLRYGFDWNNDGIIDEYTSLVASGVSSSTSHVWSIPGTFTFGVYAEDVLGARSAVVTHTIVILEAIIPGNSAPIVISVTGSSTPTANVSHTFTATATDADADMVQYGFDWNNNGVIDSVGESWTPLVASGVSASQSNSWGVSGTQTFAVFARDSRGATSTPFLFSVNVVGGLDNVGFALSTTTGLTTSESGSTAAFTIVLTAEPAADVTLSIRSSDFTEGTTSATSVTFTPANWNVFQTIIITGQDDSEDDGDIAYAIVVGPSTSADPHFNGLVGQNVSIINFDNDDTVAPPSSGGGGGGGGGGGRSGPCIGFGCPTGTVLGTSTVATVDPVITFCPASDFIVSYMRKGSQNDPNEVRKLQYFLNTYENMSLDVNGIFDDATEAAVKILQVRHADEILAPWNISEPTGIVYITTSSYINRYFCDENPLYKAGDLDSTIRINPTDVAPVDNSGDFEGAIGIATSSASSTNPSIFDNMAGVFGAFSGAVLDFLKTIPWYPIVIIILIALGTAFILRGIYYKGQTISVMSFIKGSTALTSASVLNVLNIMSFISDPAWFIKATGLGMTWVLVLGLINLLALVIVCVAFLVSAHIDHLNSSK